MTEGKIVRDEGEERWGGEMGRTETFARLRTGHSEVGKSRKGLSGHEA